MNFSRIVLLLLILLNLCGCKPKRKPPVPVKIDNTFLDSLKSKSDTTYTKEYRTVDFAVAEYFINRKDSTTAQLMKDFAGKVRQITVARKNVRTFTAQYFANGQLIARLPVDTYGRFDGYSVYYYEDGTISSEGNFKKGYRTGEWKYYNIAGKLVSKDLYNEDGQVEKSIKE